MNMTFLRKLHDCSTIAPEKETEWGEGRGHEHVIKWVNQIWTVLQLPRRHLSSGHFLNAWKMMANFLCFFHEGRGGAGQPCNRILTGLSTGIIHHDTLRVLAPASFIMQAHVLCGVALLLGSAPDSQSEPAGRMSDEMLIWRGWRSSSSSSGSHHQVDINEISQKIHPWAGNMQNGVGSAANAMIDWLYVNLWHPLKGWVASCHTLHTPALQAIQSNSLLPPPPSLSLRYLLVHLISHAINEILRVHIKPMILLCSGAQYIYI